MTLLLIIFNKTYKEIENFAEWKTSNYNIEIHQQTFTYSQVFLSRIAWLKIIKFHFYIYVIVDTKVPRN